MALHNRRIYYRLRLHMRLVSLLVFYTHLIQPLLMYPDSLSQISRIRRDGFRKKKELLLLRDFSIQVEAMILSVAHFSQESRWLLWTTKS
jgi:hypothetical protein